MGGSWDGVEPVCVGLSQHYDYSTKEPPTILFRYENGAIAQSNEGELVVAPGTILHMECLFKRKYGNPTWFIDNYSGRTYPQVGLPNVGDLHFQAAKTKSVFVSHGRSSDTY